jgi:site-specific DNA-cytosine methylase
VPTLNAFENANDTRATVIIFDTGSHGDGIRMSDETVPKLQARMGTGGNNTPMVAYSVREDAKANTFSATEIAVTNALQSHQPSPQSHHAQTFIAYPIQDGREMEKTQNGLGIGNGGDPSYTVDTTGAQSVAFDEMNFTTTAMHQTLRAGTPQSTGAVVPPSTVRRLTPTECERLQGFPDGWTAERIDEVKGLVTQADSSRYKQMGNAVAVPCVEWIVNRLVEIDRDR